MFKKLVLILIPVLCVGCQSPEDKAFKESLNKWMITETDPVIKKYLLSSEGFKESKKSALKYCNLKAKYGKEEAGIKSILAAAETSSKIKDEVEKNRIFMLSFYIESSADRSYCPDNN